MRFFGKKSLHHCGSVTLETERLVLRPFLMSDAQEMFDCWASDPLVTRYLMWRAHNTVRETEEVLAYWRSMYHRRDFYEWAIVPKGLRHPIGSIGVSKVRGDRTVLELGYCIGRKWWGQGICAEASRAVLQLMFETVGCSAVIAMHAQDNLSSGRVMEKCGMRRREGPPEAVDTENGRFYCPVYQITRRQWLEGLRKEQASACTK